MSNPNTQSINHIDTNQTTVSSKIQEIITTAVNQPDISIKVICKQIADACVKSGLHHEEATKLLNGPAFRKLAKKAAKATLHQAVVDKLGENSANCNMEKILNQIRAKTFITMVVVDLIEAAEAAMTEKFRISMKEILEEKVGNAHESEYQLSAHATYAIFNSSEAQEAFTSILLDKLRVITTNAYKHVDDLQKYDYRPDGDTLHIFLPNQRAYRVFVNKYHKSQWNEWHNALGTSEISFSIGTAKYNIDDSEPENIKPLEEMSDRKKFTEQLKRIGCYEPEEIKRKVAMAMAMSERRNSETSTAMSEGN